MKLFSTLLCLLCIGSTLYAQQPGVAINTSGLAPHSSAMLDIQSTSKGFLLPRMTQAQRMSINNPSNGLMVFDTDAQRLYQYQDDSWRSLIDNSYWAKSALRKWVYNGVDSIGIGIASPLARLHVNNGDLRVSNADINIVNGDIVHNKAGATIQLQDASVNKGFFQISGDDLRFGTNAGNSAGNVYVRMNGANRFQFAESGRMTILADQNPTLYFNTAGINKAYLQLQGENVKLDAPGNRVDIGDDFTVNDATNRIGIGTTSPEQKLHVTGNVKVNTGKILNADNVNMLPVAYGFVRGSQAGAPVLKGTPNLSASRTTGVNGNKEIRVLVSGVDLTNAIFQLTSVYSHSFISANTSVLNADGSVTVSIWSTILEEYSYSDFQIVIYVP
ncbi:hypothetical protein [Pseudobacter ginsenosidimutans]|uniref:Uncharacterized protein n=1 Tax=Pseudobacter ginsenosidimutans TaxID=661488 RepID=A0A4Q7N4W1_9BACT|nr:hypothetical protein [Pseudobacter ginsenosidimutans]QEC44594.1 hypothetical protein FSB84_24020 [Pseudobacter ginsenosidimutans]RZS76073.1 hypothetical protein EV199_1950 [Pseudobacter ginsenosidimutans]